MKRPDRGTPPPDARGMLSANMRRLRKELGLSQEALAHVAGLDRTFVSSVERQERNISLDNIARLAAALEVDMRRLFDPLK